MIGDMGASIIGHVRSLLSLAPTVRRLGKGLTHWSRWLAFKSRSRRSRSPMRELMSNIEGENLPRLPIDHKLKCIPRFRFSNGVSQRYMSESIRVSRASTPDGQEEM